MLSTFRINTINVLKFVSCTNIIVLSTGFWYLISLRGLGNTLMEMTMIQMGMCYYRLTVGLKLLLKHQVTDWHIKGISLVYNSLQKRNILWIYKLSIVEIFLLNFHFSLFIFMFVIFTFIVFIKIISSHYFDRGKKYLFLLVILFTDRRRYFKLILRYS